MALARSHSLSLNTGVTNSLFSQQNNASSQPPAAGGLFGGAANTSTNAGGGLFGGNTNTTQQQQSNNLFGGGNRPSNTGSTLFGNTQSNLGSQQGGGLFGGGQSNAAPQQGGGLFGGTQSNAGTQQGGGLFGGGQSNVAPQQGGGLFGGTQSNAASQPSGGLFGNTQSNMTSSQPAGGLFGGGTNNAASSIFGGAKPATGAGIFDIKPTQQNPQQNSIFGLSASQNNALAGASLLGASQYHTSQLAPFAGKLAMGQTSSQPATQGAAQIDYDTLRPTTRFGDCKDEIKTQLEMMENMIQAQEKFCREIEAFLPKHEGDVKSLTPDVAWLKEKADAVEDSLAVDARGVEAQRETQRKDIQDFERCQRIVENLRLPQQFHVSSVAYGGPTATPNTTAATTGGSETYDTDLIGNYFVPRASELQRTLDMYVSTLAEIEGHMRVIEQSAVGQAQQLAAKRAGIGAGRPASGEETVRELADTLRGFETSILGAAGSVGQCREGVNELVLGKLGNGLGASRSERLRRW